MSTVSITRSGIGIAFKGLCKECLKAIETAHDRQFSSTACLKCGSALSRNETGTWAKTNA